MDKWFHPTLYNEYNYLSMLGLKLMHVLVKGATKTIFSQNTWYTSIQSPYICGWDCVDITA